MTVHATPRSWPTWNLGFVCRRNHHTTTNRTTALVTQMIEEVPESRQGTRTSTQTQRHIPDKIMVVDPSRTCDGTPFAQLER